MATTTMDNPNATNKVIYWTLGVIAVIALLLFFSMRTFNTTPLDPGVSSGTSGSTTDTGTGTDSSGTDRR